MASTWPGSEAGPISGKEASGSTHKNCLHKVVTLWLRHDKVMPSWQELVDCLLHRLWGDNSSIINRIIMKHPQNTVPYSDLTG